MPDRISDTTFRPELERTPSRHDDALEAIVRDEPVKLRRRAPDGPRVVSAARRPPDVPADRRPAA